VCVTGHSLRGRLVLPTSLFILTSLSLGFRLPWIRTPGRREAEKGTDRYCPHCGRTLERLPKQGNVLFCPVDDVISETEALTDPPRL
jgi:hypothetical protein